ncbi:MAG: hypothetical protein AMXMBFR84_26080 [Candidatus Hydrogenedentota bacterium]
MAVAVAAGHNSANGIYIPEVWLAEAQYRYYTKTFRRETTKTDYDGVLKERGNTVHVQWVPQMSSKPLSIAGTVVSDNPNPEKRTFTVNRARYVAFKIDSIEDFQAGGFMSDSYQEEATKALQEDIDREYLGDIYASAGATNKGTTAGRESGLWNMGAVGAPRTLNAGNVVQWITDMSSVADEARWPTVGRYVIIPVWIYNLLLNSDLKSAFITGDPRSILRETDGMIGSVARFTFYISNLMSYTTSGGHTGWNVIFGEPAAVQTVDQFTEVKIGMESVEAVGKFSRVVNVYDWEAMKPEGLGWSHVKPAA